MAKKTKQEQPETTGAQSSSVAILQSDYTDLVAKVVNAHDAMDKGRIRKSELIADAVEGKKLHKGAFGWIMKLRKMDPVKRNEFLFHFDVYCDFEKFAREDLLDDRQVADNDDEKDLRPRHLRQPDASAEPNPVQQLAEAAGAKIQEPIDKVGRGKSPPLN